jgi:hypothetical protein
LEEEEEGDDEEEMEGEYDEGNEEEYDVINNAAMTENRERLGRESGGN